MNTKKNLYITLDIDYDYGIFAEYITVINVLIKINNSKYIRLLDITSCQNLSLIYSDSYVYTIDFSYSKWYKRNNGNINTFYYKYSIINIINLLIKIYYTHKLLHELITKNYIFLYKYTNVINDIKKLNCARFYKSLYYMSSFD